MKFATADKGFYYDLIRVPSGHIPAPMVKLWKKFPIPIKDYRDTNTFECRNCGAPSFFKVPDYCFSCHTYKHESYDENFREKEKIRQEKKDAECKILPLLVLMGKAWYVRTTRFKGDEFRTRGDDIKNARDVVKELKRK